MTQLYYGDQYLTPYWAASPEIKRTAFVENYKDVETSKILALDSVWVPLVAGSLLLLWAKRG